jgi:transcription initiation factor TFIID subunit 9B
MTQQPTLPRDARLISLLLASNPSIEDAEPAVLNQLLEFSHRKALRLLRS